MIQASDSTAAAATTGDLPRLYSKPEWAPPDPEAAARLIERTVFGTFVTAGARGLAVSHLLRKPRSRGWLAGASPSSPP